MGRAGDASPPLVQLGCCLFLEIRNLVDRCRKEESHAQGTDCGWRMRVRGCCGVQV